MTWCPCLTILTPLPPRHILRLPSRPALLVYDMLSLSHIVDVETPLLLENKTWTFIFDMRGGCGGLGALL